MGEGTNQALRAAACRANSEVSEAREAAGAYVSLLDHTINTYLPSAKSSTIRTCLIVDYTLFPV